MKIYVHSTYAKLEETVRKRIEERVQFVLKKFDSHILRVTLQLLDINGPRGGIDKSCRIEARLLPTGNIFVEHLDKELYTSVEVALDKASNAISRTVRRSRDRVRSLAA